MVPESTFKWPQQRSISLYPENRRIQSIPSYPIYIKVRFKASHLCLGLPIGLFPSGLHTKHCMASYSPLAYYIPTRLILFHLMEEWNL
jgi:hypothetical protein